MDDDDGKFIVVCELNEQIKFKLLSSRLFGMATTDNVLTQVESTLRQQSMMVSLAGFVS
jgi:hypothetical protein